MYLLIKDQWSRGSNMRLRFVAQCVIARPPTILVPMVPTVFVHTDCFFSNNHRSRLLCERSGLLLEQMWYDPVRDADLLQGEVNTPVNYHTSPTEVLIIGCRLPLPVIAKE